MQGHDQNENGIVTESPRQTGPVMVTGRAIALGPGANRDPGRLAGQALAGGWKTS